MAKAPTSKQLQDRINELEAEIKDLKSRLAVAEKYR